jgi:hypothetical protein
MLLRSFTQIILAAALATCAFGADVTGKWKMSFQTPNGQTRESTLTLKADGEKLTGSMEGGRGGPQEITDGKVSGDNVAFAVVRNFNGNEMKIQYKGVVSGDEMKLTMGMGGREMEMTAKRVP